jgi:hypothetical protein
MAKNDLLTAIDQATAALQMARKALVAEAKQASAQIEIPAAKSAAKPAAIKRVRSEEARQRMAEAQRKRWAAKKSADKKAARVAKQSYS